MRFKVNIPGVSPAVAAVVVHFFAVFTVAFLTQVVAGWAGKYDIPSLVALLSSGLAAGIIAVVNVVIGLIPTTPVVGATQNAFNIPTKVKTAIGQIATSSLITFSLVLGAALLTGATHITSVPSGLAAVLAAISAAVVAVVQYLLSLVPAPKA